MYDSIERTIRLFHSRRSLFEISLLRTIVYINNVSEERIDRDVLARVKSFVQQADIENALFTTSTQHLIVCNLQRAKTIIRDYVMCTELIKNRYYNMNDMGKLSELPLDCQELILDLMY